MYILVIHTRNGKHRIVSATIVSGRAEMGAVDSNNCIISLATALDGLPMDQTTFGVAKA